MSPNKDWKQEKERKLSMSLIDRRKEYTCGKSFVPLDQVPTLKSTQQYALKNNKEKINSEVKTKLSNELLDGFALKDIDLSEKVSLFVGDITKLEIDSIVNAANNSLLGGGGVDGAINRAAGPKLLAENRTHKGCEDGEAKLSGGYNLPAKYVISTVGPRGGGDDVLEAAYANSLNIMLQNNLKSTAFPCISTGIYGFPNDRACAIALKTVRRFLEAHHEVVDRVIFCLFMEVDIELYNRYAPIIFPSKECEITTAAEKTATSDLDADSDASNSKKSKSQEENIGLTDAHSKESDGSKACTENEATEAGGESEGSPVVERKE